MRMVGDKKLVLRGSGKAYPQVVNSDGAAFLEEAFASGLKSPRVLRVAEQMVNNANIPKSLRPKTVEEAVRRIVEFRNARARGVNPYFESTRIELPEEYIEWDPAKTLPILAHRNRMFIEAVREWGVQFERVAASIEIIAEQTQPAIGHILNTFIGSHFNKSGATTTETRQIISTVSNYQTIARLWNSVPSAMRNMGQRFANTILAEPQSVIRANLKYPPFINRFIADARRIKEMIERSGATSPLTEISYVEQGIPGERMASSGLTMFKLVELGNQVAAALTAWFQIMRDVERLSLNGPASARSRLRRLADSIVSITGFIDTPGSVERRIKRAGLSPEEVVKAYKDNNGVLPQEMVEKAMFSFVKDTQFPLTMATERVWWRSSPLARLLAKFKPFGLDQIGLIANHVARESIKGNFGPAVRFGVAMVVAGEIYNIVRDLLLDDDESVIVGLATRPEERTARGIASRMLSNFVDGGGVGMFMDLTYGIGQYILGPVGSTIENASALAVNIARKPRLAPAAIAKFVRQEFAVARQAEGIINRIDRKFLNENNRFIEYKRARATVYDHLAKQDKTIDAGEAVKTFIYGGIDRLAPGENTLALEYAARQITAGDIEDAADFLKTIVESAETPEKARQSILQSLASRAPLGPIPDDQMSEFLNSLSTEQKDRLKKINKEWIADYKKAMTIAGVKSATSNKAPRPPRPPRP
jgi:hypothetical protein